MDMDGTRAIKEAHVMDVDDEEVLKVVTATTPGNLRSSLAYINSSLIVEHR